MLKLKLSIFTILIGFVNKVYLRVSHDSGIVHSWVGMVRKRCETRGPVDTIGWIKAIRLACTRYMCGAPLQTSPGFGVQLDENGLPKGIPIAWLFREYDPPSYRLGLSLLGISRIIPGWKSPDLSPITDPLQVVIPSTSGGDLASIVRRLRWKITQPVWEECHTSTKSGPNAQAMVGSIEDAHLLTDSQISDLRTLGGDGIIERLTPIRSISVQSWTEHFALRPKGCQARLSLVKDKEAKCRIVAILDYWSQSALYPLHLALMSHLRSIRSDCTFNQGSFRATLPTSGPYYSYDLSSATDRLPVSLQEAVLAELVSPEYAAAWRRIICDREYKISWERQHRTVKYAVGQPMGAYSSWTAFAVTHHVIVRLAAVRAGLKPSFSGYALLGDDIVITNDAVAKEYLAIMEQIGVSISETKSHVSHDTFEFAKRWISRGTEVTGAPFGSLFEAIKFDRTFTSGVPTKAIKRVSYYEIATWFRELEARWLPRSYTLVSRALLVSVFQLLGRGALSERLGEKAWKFYLLPSKEDSRILRKTKAYAWAEGPLASCFAWERTRNLWVLLNECKARVIEEAIKRQLASLRRFQLEAAGLVKLMPDGVDGQSLLLSLPPFAVLRRNIAELQLEFDKAHRVRESDDMVQWLHLDVRLFLDPFAALSTRKSKTVAMAKATVLNHLTAMLRGIVELRALCISNVVIQGPLLHDDREGELILPYLIEAIDTRNILPTRGDSRRRFRKRQTKVSKKR